MHLDCAEYRRASVVSNYTRVSEAGVLHVKPPQLQQSDDKLSRLPITAYQAGTDFALR